MSYAHFQGGQITKQPQWRLLEAWGQDPGQGPGPGGPDFPYRDYAGGGGGRKCMADATVQTEMEQKKGEQPI